jgi:pyruvate ferredoxin oxidoreductase gamma subunit
VTEGLEEDGTVLVNTALSPAEVREITGFKTGKVFTVNASHIAIEELGREITNTPMLGALAEATGLFEQAALIEQVRAWFSKKISAKAVEANVRALKRAGQEIEEG